MNGFAGKDAETIEPWMLVPYPRDARKQSAKLRDRTVRVLIRLLNQGNLPGRIEGLIRGFSEVADQVDEEE